MDRLGKDERHALRKAIRAQVRDAMPVTSLELLELNRWERAVAWAEMRKRHFAPSISQDCFYPLSHRLMRE